MTGGSTNSSRRTRFSGVITATPTPFTVDGEFDEPRLVELIEHYLAAGVHGISVAGSQGEFFALTEAERIREFEIAVETVAGRVPVYGGSGEADTRRSVEFSKRAAAIGVDVAMVITPYFVSPTVAELVDHYRRVADASPIPVLAYNNPPRTGVNITPATYRECAEHENIVGIKDSSGDLTQIIEYVAVDRDRVVYCGRDTLVASTLLHGGAGTISPAACVFPELMVRMYDLARAGNWQAALEISDLLTPLRAAWSLGSFPVVIKEAMARVGLGPGPARLPIHPLDDDARATLWRIVDGIQATSAGYLE